MFGKQKINSRGKQRLITHEKLNFRRIPSQRMYMFEKTVQEILFNQFQKVGLYKGFNYGVPDYPTRWGNCGHLSKNFFSSHQVFRCSDVRSFLWGNVIKYKTILAQQPDL